MRDSVWIGLIVILLFSFSLFVLLFVDVALGLLFFVLSVVFLVVVAETLSRW